MMDRINKDTLIPISLAFALITSIAGVAVWLNNRLASINYHIEALKVEVQTVQEKLDTAAKNVWTSRDMQLWVELLRAKNPDIKIPDIK